MEEEKPILYEVYVYCEWKPEPEYLQSPDTILPEGLSSFWRWLKFYGPKKSLIDSVSVFKEKQHKWHLALGDEGKVIAVLTDNILEIRTKRSDYGTIAARTTVHRDPYSQWRKVVWSPDCSFVAVAYGNGIVSFFDLTASNLFSIPADCSRPGGLECTDNTHAVADIVFLPLRVKHNQWSWEVLIVTFDGKLRGYLVSQAGFKLRHAFSFAGGVSALAYSAAHALLYVAGVPRGKDPSGPLRAGLTAWRALAEPPHYALSAVSDRLEAELAAARLPLHVPFVGRKKMEFIVHMSISPDGARLACVHCSGDVTVWRLPLLQLLHRWAPEGAAGAAGEAAALPPLVADLAWWNDEELVISRLDSSAVVRGAAAAARGGPVALRGVARVCGPAAGAALLLTGATRTRRPGIDTDAQESSGELAPSGRPSAWAATRALARALLYALTDLEAFQPAARAVTVVSRVYRLLAVVSCTPLELFTRKIESGHYAEALRLAAAYELDADRVYQQQWRKTPVSPQTIENYLSKVSKKAWVVRQCAERLPETLPVARQLLDYGLRLTRDELLLEVNTDLEEPFESPEAVPAARLERLPAPARELLRHRRAMLLYRERLALYEEILAAEVSTYSAAEYALLRGGPLRAAAARLAAERRLQALRVLRPRGRAGLEVLSLIPDTVHPSAYADLLPGAGWGAGEAAAAGGGDGEAAAYRSDLESGGSEEGWGEAGAAAGEAGGGGDGADQPTMAELAAWYERRARDIEANSNLIDYAVSLVTIGRERGVAGLEELLHHLRTLDTLVYGRGLEDSRLREVEALSVLDTCRRLMIGTCPDTFIEDLQRWAVPYLRRTAELRGDASLCVDGLCDYVESLSVDDLAPLLLVLEARGTLGLDARAAASLAWRCVLAHGARGPLAAVAAALPADTDGSISGEELAARAHALRSLAAGAAAAWRRGAAMTPRELHEHSAEPRRAALMLTSLARTFARSISEEKSRSTKTLNSLKRRRPRPGVDEWAPLLRDILELQECLFTCVSKEQCYEIYASSLLTSGSAECVRLAGGVLAPPAAPAAPSAPPAAPAVPAARAAALVAAAAREYINSASSLDDPALELARCCLSLVKEPTPEVQEELDLLAALQIMGGFNLAVLPIQVRICTSRMSLIEACLDAAPAAPSHKLLRLAALLRVAGDDEQRREACVLQAICERTGACARRLAALRHAPAAPLLYRLAATTSTMDASTRQELLAAAATYCAPDQLEAVLRTRLSVELEAMQASCAPLRPAAARPAAARPAAVRPEPPLDRCPSADEEFADAVTTPVTETKDFVETPKDKSLLNQMLESWTTDTSYTSDEQPAQAVHVQEFYAGLYPQHAASARHYRYDRFVSGAPGAAGGPAGAGGPDGAGGPARAALHWHLVKSCLDDASYDDEFEFQVLQKCAEESLYSDTALSVAYVLRSITLSCRAALQHDAADQPEAEQCRTPLQHATETAQWRITLQQSGEVGACVALYAALIHCCAAELGDDVYLTKPVELFRRVPAGASAEARGVLAGAAAALARRAEALRLRAAGCAHNLALYAADPEYRREVLLRLAETTDPERYELAVSLARKHGVPPLEAWLRHARAALAAGAARDLVYELDDDPAHVVQRLHEEVYCHVGGTEHNRLVEYWQLVRRVRPRAQLDRLTPQEHVSLLKKVKAASNELDYKLLTSAPAPERLHQHLLRVLRPESAGMVGKLLRALPPQLGVALSVTELYVDWLVKYFFEVPPGSESGKKWMQQYRQCSSFFTKLPPPQLAACLRRLCFSDEAIDRVPGATRGLMLLQAADFCAQEHDNDAHANKGSGEWSETAAQLTRWARFLDNVHAACVRAVVAQHRPADPGWRAVEASAGCAAAAARALRALALSGLRGAALQTLLRCLHLPLAPEDVLDPDAAEEGEESSIEQLVSCLTAYVKEGVTFGAEYVERVLRRAEARALPPPRLAALLALADRAQDGGGDSRKMAAFTVNLIKAEWSGCDFVEGLDESELSDAAARDAVLRRCAVAGGGGWQREKALVDILACWPPTTSHSHPRSVHGECARRLVLAAAPGRALLRRLLRRPVLSDEDLDWLCAEVRAATAAGAAAGVGEAAGVEEAAGERVVNLLWALLLHRTDKAAENIPRLVNEHKETLKDVEIEDELVAELVAGGLLGALVSTPLYARAAALALGGGGAGGAGGAGAAAAELLRAGHRAEAGHLLLQAAGVPAALRGFTQAVLYCKRMMKE